MICLQLLHYSNSSCYHNLCQNHWYTLDKVQIEDGNGNLLHETQVTSSFDAERFRFNPADLSVIQSEDGDVGVQWTDSYPCVESYDVILKGGDDDDAIETVLVKEETSQLNQIKLVVV